MPDPGPAHTEHILRELADVVTSPAREVPSKLSALLSTFVPHDGLIILAADAGGGHRRSVGDAAFVDGVSFLDLDERRRELPPGTARNGELSVNGVPTAVLQVVSRNGALLVMAAGPADEVDRATVLQLWSIVALRVQEPADIAPPSYLQFARAASGERMEALTELADEYSTTLESVLGALRSAGLDDRAARHSAIGIAAEGLVHLRTASDRVRTVTEEPVTTAFERLRDDLRPLMRYREIDVQFVEPPIDGRPLPSEVAHGARAVVRGSILALVDRPAVNRVRVQWDCDGTNLLIHLRDDGPGVAADSSTQLQLVRQRVHALDGRLTVDATPGWGTEMSVVIPLDPPHVGPADPAWNLRPREVEVLKLLAEGRRNRSIATELGISENTVKFHISRVLRKLGANSRAEAVAVVLAANARL
ncbi:MAG TPA: LuxR C-terminal-related transcriptional regulator [Microbacterium sp.]|uniref:LuxR C-terminal-related transcriptional regulator n=1 Tax=Microbacterium sp. TaxID=51671 RepID=UPI002CDB73A4|nr:LuxR C-terminal-related transcriptional regulator [Microbacterium sp.]HWI31047.1 LuxR C-terminal-related transcriptional regulator [Microbacterium sp.]